MKNRMLRLSKKGGREEGCYDLLDMGSGREETDDESKRHSMQGLVGRAVRKMLTRRDYASSRRGRELLQASDGMGPE